MPKLLVVATDKSGDVQASHLYRKMVEKIPGLQAIGFGGAAMEAAGIQIRLGHLAHLGVMGFKDWLRLVPEYYKVIKDFYFLLKSERPDAVLFVQNPGLNLILAKLAMEQNVPRILYFPPEIWAWGPRFYGDKRVQKILERFSCIISCFDFEHATYTAHAAHLDFPTQALIFEGHPLVDVVRPSTPSPQLKKILDENSGADYISLLPGSRPQEIRIILPKLHKVATRLAKKYQNLRFFLPAASGEIAQVIEKTIQPVDFPLFILSQEDRYASLTASKLALATSGTVTLETALLGVPTIIVYDADFLNPHVRLRMSAQEG